MSHRHLNERRIQQHAERSVKNRIGHVGIQMNAQHRSQTRGGKARREIAPIVRDARSYRCFSSRRAFATTISVAPVSAAMASQRLA